MNYEILNHDPEIILFKSFLTDREISFLLEEKEFSKTKGVAIGKGSQRNSKVYYEKGLEFNQIRGKIFNFLTSINFNYPLKNYEEIRLLKYKKDQQFTRHYDFFNQTPGEKLRYNDRVATVLIYLEEAEKGGKTIFNDLDIEIQGKPGDLLFYRYDTLSKFQTSHTGEKVLKGQKTIMGMCIREYEYDIPYKNKFD